MIGVGVTAVADHPTLAQNGKVSTLGDLARYFPVVEIDTSFYACPRIETVRHWQQQVPAAMRFIVKATQFMTRHKDSPTLSLEFDQLEQALVPLVQSQQLAAILFQFPPYFGVTPQNVRYLRWIRARYPELPLAVEFRHDGWYLPAYRQQTLELLRGLGMIHVVVDEPQTPAGSVPLVAEATSQEATILRLHGQNYAGWQEHRGGQWRSRRTNYRYSKEELGHLGEIARRLTSRDVWVIFNNNGGGDAADNALAFIAQEHLTYRDLAPRQMDLF